VRNRGPQRRGSALHCAYELTQEDCTEGRQFDDQIALFSFIDTGSHFVWDAGVYGIPYRALLPPGLHNVLIAGRMMTVDLVAHDSLRNIVSWLACGATAYYWNRRLTRLRGRHDEKNRRARAQP